jgi:hypothetical protein
MNGNSPPQSEDNSGFDALRYLQQAEKFQEHFVKPLVEAVRQELIPVKARLDQVEAGVIGQGERLLTLENHEKKALLGWTGMVFLVTSAFAYLGGNLRAYLARLFK